MRNESNELCPSCGKKGRAVKPVTIESLVSETARARSGSSDGFRFCPEPSCDTAYFNPETGGLFVRGDVKVRIGQKETTPPRPICYCFGHTLEKIERDVAATGTSAVPDAITAECRKGLDRCEETNPQGACCLGNVRLAVKAAQAAIVRAGQTPASKEQGENAGATDSCCAV